ncbi:MAG: roadblock/LC7 domain-containing protein [Desulfuromonadales bacterium]|nr:MAG: roadblock/LC7 domain-containing protein [Desulfuromonadales bacterium]
MEEILQQVNGVQGVIGSLVCGSSGEVLAHAFPPLFDAAIIEGASAVVADRGSGLRQAAGSFDLLDLRYGDGRIIIKPLQEAYLLLLCTRTINVPVLTISLNVAKGKLDTVIAARGADGAGELSGSAASVATSAAGSSLLMLTVCHLDDATKGSSFEQFGMAAITPATARQITTFYNGGSFKKLKLTGGANGVAGVFPVMVVNESDVAYDGKIILCKAIEKKLQASPGDVLTVELS